MTTKENMDDTTMKELEKKVEKRVEEAVTTGTTILIQAAIAFGITVVVLKFVWAWVVADLFPGAVAQGLINANLTWLAAVKFNPPALNHAACPSKLIMSLERRLLFANKK